MQQAHRHLTRAAAPYPELARLIRRNGPITLETGGSGDLFEFLSQTIISQQLSVKAADTIWSRVLDLRRRKRVKTVQNLARPRYRDDLTGCGISGRKAEAMIRVAEDIRRGRLQPETLRSADHHKVVDVITGLYGFGPWSAEMVSMFYAGQPDVWSPGDVALVRGLGQLLPPGTNQAEVVERFSPYRTYLALHIWQREDATPLEG